MRHLLMFSLYFNAPLVHKPIQVPFLVKKAVFVRKFIPQPMTSKVPNFGPKVFPDVVLVKQSPSSPWYANESGSHPGIRFRGTFEPENPTPIILLDLYHVN